MPDYDSCNRETKHGWQKRCVLQKFAKLSSRGRITQAPGGVCIRVQTAGVSVLPEKKREVDPRAGSRYLGLG
jgi:hypothetical protein